MRNLTAASDSAGSAPLTMEELIAKKRLLIADYKELAVSEPSEEGFYRGSEKEDFIYYAPYVLMYRSVICYQKASIKL